tara:strand:+ start:15866 stop:16906 length:1041 start_codon:yes stop_codon:yes gene_type:complete
MTIKHIVLCGGGPIGFVQFGVLEHLIENNIVNKEDIESVYCTSIGCVISLMIILKIPLQNWRDYLIKRPWEKLVTVSKYDYLNLFYTKGLFDIKFINSIIEPLLRTNDLTVNITLLELYNITKIDLHIFTTNLNKIDSVDFNYKSFPNLKLNECIYMSMCAPGLLKPYFMEDECYIDGAFLANCPYFNCIKDKKCSPQEILILNLNRIDTIHYTQKIYNYITENNIDYDTSLNIQLNNGLTSNITSDSNIITFFIYIVRQLVHKVTNIENLINTEDYEFNVNIENSKINCCYTCDNNSIFDWLNIISTKECRKNLIYYGKILAIEYIDKINKIYKIDISNQIVCED